MLSITCVTLSYHAFPPSFGKISVSSFCQAHETALFWAADSGRLEAVQLLVDRGANVNILKNVRRTCLVKISC